MPRLSEATEPVCLMAARQDPEWEAGGSVDVVVQLQGEEAARPTS